MTLSLFFVVFYSSFSYFTRVKLFNFKVDYNFLRLQRGSNLFRVEGGGGSICLFPIENHITCDFQGVWTPSSPSHLDWSMSYLHIILAQNTSSSLPLNKRMPNCVSYPKIPSKTQSPGSGQIPYTLSHKKNHALLSQIQFKKSTPPLSTN